MAKPIRKSDKRYKPRQAANFGLALHDLSKHGAYSYLRFGTHRCKNCILRKTKKCDIYGTEIQYNGETTVVHMDTECPIIETYIDGTVSQIMALPHIQDEDVVSVNQLARALGFVALANKYLNEVGIFRVRGDVVDVQPLVTAIAKYENLISKLSDSLGLNPRARSSMRLNLENVPLAKLIKMNEEKNNAD